MKHEEMNDISTILVEPTDVKNAVVHWVSCQNKPVVIVVPENARRVFQRPEDFRDLRRVKRHLAAPVTLVIEGNERQREWARRNGFQVYSSTAACANRLVQYGTTEPLRRLSPRITISLSPTDAGSLSPALDIQRQTPIITEPMPRLKTEAPSTQIAPAEPGLQWRDTLLFVLLALLILGILGGLGFGYLLTVLHITRVSIPFTPTEIWGNVSNYMDHHVLQTWSLTYAASRSTHNSTVVTLIIRR